MLVGGFWAELSGDTCSHPLTPLCEEAPGSTRQPSCLCQGIQPWFGAASIEGREDSWSLLSDIVEFLGQPPVKLLSLWPCQSCYCLISWLV